MSAGATLTAAQSVESLLVRSFAIALTSASISFTSISKLDKIGNNTIFYLISRKLLIRSDRGNPFMHCRFTDIILSTIYTDL